MNQSYLNNDDQSVAHLRSSFGDDQVAFLDALKKNNLAAASELYDRYVNHVRMMLIRILGPDDELQDLISETFYQILKGVSSVNNAQSLPAWISKTTIYVAKGAIRKRKRRKWLFFVPDSELYNDMEGLVDEEAINTARAVRAIVDTMSVNDQLIFTLRYFYELNITELADALGVSKATVKRKLAMCESRFKIMAMGNEQLREMVTNSPKWRKR